MVSGAAAPAEATAPLQQHLHPVQGQDNNLEAATPPESPSKSTAATPAKPGSHQAAADSAEELYPPPPAAGSPSDEGPLPPPPAYEDVIKHSEMHRHTGSTGSSLRTAQHAAVEKGQQPEHTAADSPTVGRRLEIIDRNAAEALQIQVSHGLCSHAQLHRSYS